MSDDRPNTGDIAVDTKDEQTGDERPDHRGTTGGRLDHRRAGRAARAAARDRRRRRLPRAVAVDSSRVRRRAEEGRRGRRLPGRRADATARADVPRRAGNPGEPVEPRGRRLDGGPPRRPQAVPLVLRAAARYLAAQPSQVPGTGRVPSGRVQCQALALSERDVVACGTNVTLLQQLGQTHPERARPSGTRATAPCSPAPVGET
jgi:hypothetical protein